MMAAYIVITHAEPASRNSTSSGVATSDWGQPASCRITGLEALSEDHEPASPSTIGRLSRPVE